MKRIIDILFGVVMALISVLLTYAYQCLILYLDAVHAPIKLSVVLIVLSGIPLILAQIIFIAINVFIKARSASQFSLIVIFEMIVFTLLMLFLFSHIPIPYSLIIPRELATDYAQLVLQIFSIGTAVVCGIISGIVFLVKKEKH